MTRYIYILIAASVAVFIFGGLSLSLYLWWNPAPTSAPEQNTPGGQQNPGETVTVENPPAAQKPAAHLKEDVRLAFRRTLPAGDPTELRETSVAGDYALQVWSDGVMGGQVLMKYDAANGGWAIVAETGGAYSVAGLNAEGVPQQLVLALLDGLKFQDE